MNKVESLLVYLGYKNQCTCHSCVCTSHIAGNRARRTLCRGCDPFWRYWLFKNGKESEQLRLNILASILSPFSNCSKINTYGDKRAEVSE